MKFDPASIVLSAPLIQVLEELGFEQFTPVQTQSIPLLLEGKDLIGQSKTGSGKTAAFTLPILEKIGFGDKKSDKRLYALVISPTRELCTQVAREIRKLGRHQPGLRVLILSGGQPMAPQLDALLDGVHIVVGTPGRVMDHLKRKSLDLRKVSTVVLDEADRMLEMGFQEDMETILNATPKQRQTVLFSATFPKTIEEMSKAYQKSPVRVTVEDGSKAHTEISHRFYETSPENKYATLLGVIRQEQPESAIVFCNLKATVIALARELSGAGVSVAAIHGDLEQADRDRVMAKFRNQSVRVLVATDVAARGIDVENLDIVFNFDVPSQPEIYVHRVGRTGRAGKKGLAISLISPKEKIKMSEIGKYARVPWEQKNLAIGHKETMNVKYGIKHEAKMDTLYISAGRKEKMRPGDILGALTGDAGGLEGAEIGKIEIHDHFSYVAVSRKVSKTALQRLNDGRIKGRKFKVHLVR